MTRPAGFLLLMLAVLLAGCNVFGDFNNPDDPWGTKYGKYPGVSLTSRTRDLLHLSFGTVIFPVSTANVAEGTAGSVDWFADAAATVPASAPAGVTVTVTPVSGQASTVTMTETAPATLGQYRFRVRFGSAASFPATLGVRLLPVVPVSGGIFSNGTANMTVGSFRMGIYDVTRAQFQEIMGSDPSTTGSSSGLADPVQHVNWYQAVAFCNKLSLAEGLTPVYSVAGVDFSALPFASIPTSSSTLWDTQIKADWTANGYRLPTEAEWMWAAMGGRSDARPGDIDANSINSLGHTKGYSGSIETGAAQTNINDYAWTSSNAASTTHPVGTKAPNELGLCDMSGNVSQWCWDWFDLPLPSAAMTDYQGPSSGSERVDRGGAWDIAIGSTGLDTRDKDAPVPVSPFEDIGFRVVRR